MLRGEKWTFASHGPPYLICTKLFYFIYWRKGTTVQGALRTLANFNSVFGQCSPCRHCGIAGFNWHCEGRT